MARHNTQKPSLAALLLSSLLISSVAAVDFDFCSNQNTGPSSPNSESDVNSQGACFDTCKFQYAFAITQYKQCWCSNFAPGSTVGKGTCSTKCPGFPFEFCGGPSSFAYRRIVDNPIEGTKGSGGSKPTTSAPPKSTSLPPPPPPTSSSSSSSSASSYSTTSTTSSSSSSDSDSSSSRPKTTTPVSTVVEGGKTVTVYATPTETGDRSHDNTPVDTNKSGLSTGAIVGIVVGVIGGILVLAGAILLVFMRRRKQEKEDQYHGDSSVRGSGSRHGRGSPSSPGSAGNRSSMLQVDPRMDPFQQGLYARSGSSESVNTLRDDHDYSRRIQQPKVLRATNPDPEHS